MASAFANMRLLFVGDSHVRYLHNWGEADCSAIQCLVMHHSTIESVRLGRKSLPKCVCPQSPTETNQTIAKLNITVLYLLNKELCFGGSKYAAELELVRV